MDQKYQRYQRQIKLRDFGREAQDKLFNASVIVVGAGGLGCPALQYLAAAGTGTLGIVDDDTISMDNLHRQILYGTADIGKSKAVCAGSALAALNPDVRIKIYESRLANHNALEILGGYDVIIDGTDNFASRYLINDACVLLNKPLIYGSISRHEGQLAVFNAAVYQGTPANYRDLFPDPPDVGEVQTCEESGVLGVLPGIIGTMQANEAIKLITGMGEILANLLFTYNSLSTEIYKVEISPRKKNRTGMPATEDEFRTFDYHWFCGRTFHSESEIDVKGFHMLARKGNMAVLDIRSEGENPGFDGFFPYYRIPISELEKDLHLIGKEKEVVVVCQAGISSLKAIKILTEKFGSEKNFYSLRGGINVLNLSELKNV
jgi:sulfur-carrier protein adenylyltransferase/sulfurtransferase